MIRLSGHDAEVTLAAGSVRQALGDFQPRIAIVLGSGLGSLADRVAQPRRVGYADIPGFHVPRVEGHKGELVAGMLAGVPVLLQSGRFHMYEGHSVFDAALPARVLATLGCEALIVTNAAGGVNPAFGPGTLMLLRDHLNLTGRNPLEGEVLAGEVRFPDMTAAYDPALRDTVRRVATARGIDLAEGIYAGLLGPSYETPAEVRMLGHLGADAVGMSTVVEVIAARARGMRCLGISLITNPGAGISPEPLDHAEVMATAAAAGGRLADLVEAAVGAL